MTILLGVVLLLTVPAAPAQQRLASTAAHPYGDESAESLAVASAPVALPPNVTVPAAYDDLMSTMLRLSATFRAQCARLARTPQLDVTVRRSISAAPQAALTHLTRRGDGRIEAEVEIGLFGDVVLLIAHEFEHIIEQLDGVDLISLADRPGTGVRTDPRNGQFETERAITIGQRVAREVSRAVARR
jgi:hypothetical protein